MGNGLEGVPHRLSFTSAQNKNLVGCDCVDSLLTQHSKLQKTEEIFSSMDRQSWANFRGVPRMNPRNPVKEARVPFATSSDTWPLIARLRTKLPDFCIRQGVYRAAH